MKVIKIRKGFRSGVKEHFLILSDEASDSDESIEYLVEDWCYSDPSGSSYGFTFEWSIVEDKDIIHDAIVKEKINLNDKILRLLKRKEELDIFLELNSKKK